LAFADRVDHALLFATEQMLDCRTLACVARGSAITELLALLRRRIERSETSFDTIRDSREMAWTICNYAEELRARRIAVARVTSHVWVRFYRQKAIRDLLFRILPAKHGAFAYGLPGDATKVFLPSADTRKDGVSDAAEPL
jgi:hypothetical protein